jgi:hypothetical protein
MNSIGAAVLSATALMLATVAVAHAQSPGGPGLGQETQSPFVAPDPTQGEPASHPLFTIGGVEAHIWAPVEPHYDANNNRNLAANPLWAG